MILTWTADLEKDPRNLRNMIMCTLTEMMVHYVALIFVSFPLSKPTSILSKNLSKVLF